MRALPLLLSTLLLLGCPIRDQDRSPGGGGMPGGSGGAGGMQAPNTVSITSPTATVYTNASVTIAIGTSQPTTSTVTLVAAGPDGSQTIGTVTAPQTSLVWNTTGAGEGTYSVTAELTTNGNVVSSNTTTIVVDRTPPKVVVSSLVPAPGASNVVLVAPIEVPFSEPILLSTISASAIPIQTASGTTLPTTLTLSSDGTTATIDITSDKGISLNQAFTGSFAKTITDLAGNGLLEPSTTWSWIVPVWIKYAPLDSRSLPVVAVGTNFQPIVGYTVCGVGNSGDACPPVLHIAVSDGQAWNDLGTPGGGGSSNNTAIFVDAQDHPNVAWGSSTSGGVGEVLFASWDGTAWQTSIYPPIMLATSATSDVNALALAIDSMGRPVVAYRGEIYTPAAKTDIYVAAWTGSTWNTTFGAVGDPTSNTIDLLLNNQDVPIVTAVNSDNSSGAFLWSGTSWAFTAGAQATNAAGALDTNGNPVMLNSTTATSWLPEHLTNSAWLPLVATAVPSSSMAGSPSLTNITDRLPVVAWYEPAVSPQSMALARWSGTAWDTRAGSANAGGFPNNQPPALLVDGRNDIWIGWTEGTQINVWMSNY
jgi:hypothetical protein